MLLEVVDGYLGAPCATLFFRPATMALQKFVAVHRLPIGIDADGHNVNMSEALAQFRVPPQAFGHVPGATLKRLLSGHVIPHRHWVDLRMKD